MTTTPHDPHEVPPLLARVLFQVTKGRKLFADIAGRVYAPGELVQAALDRLQAAHMVVNVGGQWMPASPAAVFSAGRLAQVGGSGGVFLEAGPEEMRVVADGLELVARVGCAQLDRMQDVAGFQEMSRADKSLVQEAESVQVGSLMGKLKLDVLGFASNESHEIHSPYVSLLAKTCWDIARKIRFRMAWDFATDRRLGGWHAEPPAAQCVSQSAVYSRPHAGDQIYRVELSRAAADLMLEGMAQYVAFCASDFSPVGEMLRTGRLLRVEGSLVPKDALKGIRQRLAQIAGVYSGDIGRTQTQAQVVCSNVIDLADRVVGGRLNCLRSNGFTAGTVAGGPEFLPDLADFPPSRLVVYYEGSYKVLVKAHRAEVLVVVGDSHSFQTACLLARTHRSGFRADRPFVLGGEA